jgi:hypothetical protein
MVMQDASTGTPTSLTTALKEWAVAVRALREGRQIILLRKGGIREEGGEFEVAARDVLLFPTYIHADEQRDALQPCYTAWRAEEDRRRAPDDQIRLDAWARITDIHIVTKPEALYTLASQHIFSDSFLKYRIENEPHKPLYALFLRAYELPKPVVVPMELDYYGCKSWITLTEPVDVAEARPCLSDHTYAERVRVTLRHLTGATSE